MECCRVLTVPTLPFLACDKTIIVNERPGAAVIWHIAAVEFFMMLLVLFLHAAERGVVQIQCYDLQRGQRGCGVLFSLSIDILHGVYLCIFA